MNRWIAAALGVLISTAALAQDRVEFAGEQLVRKHESLGTGAGLVEFVPADETVRSWTRLVGFRAMPANGQTAAQAATALAALAEKRYPGAKPRVHVKGSEALVEFVLAAPGGLMEFNVFRYAPGPGGRGLVSLQYARRYRGLRMEEVRSLTGRFVHEAARGDMEQVRRAFQATPGQARL